MTTDTPDAGPRRRPRARRGWPELLAALAMVGLLTAYVVGRLLEFGLYAFR